MKPETRSFYHHAVRRTVERIVAGLDEALDLEQLARAAALSPFHFHRVFRGMVGETPLELHRRLRLERAAWTLLNTSTPVTSIAFDAGYDTHEAFTRAFRERYALSPSEFRRSARREGPNCASLRFEIAARSGLHYCADDTAPVSDFFIAGEDTMKIEIKDMPELRVATLRHIGPYKRINETFARLGEIAWPAGLLGDGTKMLGMYYDDPETTPEAELRSDAALTVSNGAAVPNGLIEQRISGGRYAMTTHLGSYETLGDTWARLMGEWLPNSGHRVGSGVSYEIYLNTPADVPDEELRTEIYIPLV